MKKSWIIAWVMFAAMPGVASAQYPSWQHSGSVWLLTTPDGADLPAAVLEDGFPVLVRLHKEFFPFGQAQPQGRDIRFAAAGKPLAYQIEEWDAAAGKAGIWVRVPTIKGNARQEIRLYWGNAGAASESNGAAVFNESNGFVSVWHMSDPVKDEVGTLESKDTGTIAATGIIGPARHFPGGKGVFCGDKITNYPSGASPHSSEAWVRIEKANATIIGWGNEGGNRGSKVRMQFRSPPHLHIDSDFSDVEGDGALPLGEWMHVAHTYHGGEGKIYINGRLYGTAKTPLDIKSPSRLWLGGWYNNYDFLGDMDEVRISKVARSAAWVKLEYENQKPLQSLVGLMVQAGGDFAVAPVRATVAEGKSATFIAKAGGAQKITWILKREGRESVVAADRFAYIFEAGRVTGDQAAKLVVKAVYPDGVKTREIPVTVRKEIPDPEFSLRAPAAWDGRTAVEVVPEVSNLALMQAKGAGAWKVAWKLSGLAVIKEVRPGKLILTRAQNSGPLTVTATLDNGGQPVTRRAVITVTEPETDPWVARVPGKDEQPEDNQFYARDDKDEGTLFYNGTLDAPAGLVFLKVYADDKPYKGLSAKPGADRSYAFTVKLKPGLVKYKVEFGTKDGDAWKVLRTVNNLVCGDAYLIDGQSNALATDTGEKPPPETSEWIRSYGKPEGNARDTHANLWCLPVWKARNGEKAELGYWGMDLAKRLVVSHRMPVFLINAAVGGTRIDQHQRNEADSTDLGTIYGRMLWRVRQAKLTHGIRAILWHQGENNQGAASPTGDYDWKSYQDYFIEMSAGWKRDFPNARYYYVFQIWPNACSMAGRSGAGDMIREIQRGLPRLYSHMGVMSTLGITPPGGCHFPLAGWAEFARLIQPLIERDMYGVKPAGSITPPNIKRVHFTGATGDGIAIEFDQPVVWLDSLAGQFYLAGEKGKVASGVVNGNTLTLKLKEPSKAGRITYLKEAEWSQNNLLYGANGIAALTFCDVPITSE